MTDDLFIPDVASGMSAPVCWTERGCNKTVERSRSLGYAFAKQEVATRWPVGQSRPPNPLSPVLDKGWKIHRATMRCGRAREKDKFTIRSFACLK
jgi:hypothetical protein